VFDQTISGDSLSTVRGDFLIAEVLRRCHKRSPKWLKPIIGRIMKRKLESM
jgi:hypothetical protein